jgi:hypothetical protein
MSPDEQFLASQYWFAWDDPTARRALLAAVLSRFLPAAEVVFARNRVEGRCPTNWTDFEVLRRNSRNIARVVSGEYTTTLEFLVGSAAVLQLDVREFFPDTVEWVALATYYVVTTRQRQELEKRGYSPRDAFEAVRQAENGITMDHTRLYARTLLAHPPCADRLATADVLRHRWDDYPHDQQLAIQRVIERVSAVMVESDRTLLKREKAR